MKCSNWTVTKFINPELDIGLCLCLDFFFCNLIFWWIGNLENEHWNPHWHDLNFLIKLLIGLNKNNNKKKIARNLKIISQGAGENPHPFPQRVFSIHQQLPWRNFWLHFLYECSDDTQLRILNWGLTHECYKLPPNRAEERIKKGVKKREGPIVLPLF